MRVLRKHDLVRDRDALERGELLRDVGGHRHEVDLASEKHLGAVFVCVCVFGQGEAAAAAAPQRVRDVSSTRACSLKIKARRREWRLQTCGAVTRERLYAGGASAPPYRSWLQLSYNGTRRPSASRTSQSVP